MFIHIGGDTVVSTKEVIAILDHQTVKTSPATRKFIEDERKPKRLIAHNGEEVKSFVITTDVIYCSPISSVTLKRRAGLKASMHPGFDFCPYNPQWRS